MAAKKDSEKSKTCFVISPIGEPGSPERSRADKVFRHVIKPAASDQGYEVQRADHDHRPGSITSQIVGHLIEDDLVIADLTGHNANVFYELAIRHAVKMPVLQLVETGHGIPFDVRHLRTIVIDHTDLDSVESAKIELIDQIIAVEKDPRLADSPITQAVQLKHLAQSSIPEDQRYAQILDLLETLASKVGALTSPSSVQDRRRSARRPGLTPNTWQSSTSAYETLVDSQLRRRLNLQKHGPIPPEMLDSYQFMKDEAERRVRSHLSYGGPILSPDDLRRIVDETVLEVGSRHPSASAS